MLFFVIQICFEIYCNSFFSADKKIFGEETNYNREKLITKYEFYKKSLSDKKFSFYEWFYAVMKLTRDHLKSLWCNNHVVGFISKEQAKQKLQRHAKGTFLLRFSDNLCYTTQKGQKETQAAVSFVLLQDETNFTCFNAEPFSYADLNTRSIAKRLNDMDKCVYLYPHVEKSLVFGPKSKPPSKPSRYYIIKVFFLIYYCNCSSISRL